jgi:serine/threonine protein kinase
VRRSSATLGVTALPPKTVAPGAVTDFLARLARAPQRGIPAAAPTLRPGQVVGRFEIVREVGRGGFGTVYEARDRDLQRTVALKVLHTLPDSKGADEGLAREAEAAAQLSSPNIVTLHDLVDADGIAYLVFEYLRGVTLAERLRLGAVEAADALRIARAVASGLAHAHERGVFHRDLTPGNVFLCDDGAVKILDFGMAHGLGRRKLDGGTRFYMAPEQRRGAPEDERTDVFALGVILYQMLSAEFPFPDARSLEGPSVAARLDVAAAPGLGALLARMLAKDPVARPRNGRAVADELTALTLQPAEAGHRAAKVLIHRRTSPWPAVVVVVLAVAGGVWSWRGRLGPVKTDADARTATVPERNVATSPPPPPNIVVEPSPPAPPPRSEPLPRLSPARPRDAGAVSRCRDSIGAFATPTAASGQGVLLIEADPFGEVFLDGTPQGEAPKECVVSEGLHRVRVVHRKLGSRDAVVRCEPGQRTRWLAQFEAPP